jgi:DNA-binding CsgD family transcriptional regulator
MTLSSWKGPELVGRRAELEVVSAFLNSCAGDGAALMLAGDPGVGKTALLEAAVAAAAQSGMLVLRAAGVQFEAAISFSGLNEALLPLHREFVALAPTQRNALNVALGFADGDTPDSLIVSNATLALVRDASLTRPLLFVIDDLHWLDRASAAVFEFVARRLKGSRVGFLAARRLGEEGPLDGSGLPEHELQPLDADASELLIGRCFPALAPRVRDRVLAEAAGNPLALLELPNGLSALRDLPLVLPLGRRLERIFAARIENLSDSVRRLLLVTALDGTGDLRVLGAGDGGATMLDDLHAAELAGLASVDESSHQLVFRHPLIRSAVVGLASHQERRAAHRALAEVMASNPDRHAWHLAEATLEPDEAVAGLLEQAARRILRRGDAPGAVSALARAAALSPAGTDRSRRLAEAAYIGADMNGELRNVEQLLADARRADPQTSSSLHTAIAAAYSLLNADGDVDTAHSVVTGAIAARSQPYAPNDPTLIEALHTLLYVCLWAQRPELWDGFQAALARLTGEGVDAQELRLEVHTLADPARTATAPVLARLDEAIAGLRDEVDITRVDRVVRAAIDVDRTPDCRAALWSVIRDGRRGGAVTAAIFALQHLSITDFFVGLWDEAQELVDEGLALCESHGYALLAWPFRRTQAVIAAARGDAAAASAASARMLSWAEPRRIGLVQIYAHHAQELASLGSGDFEGAYQHVRAICPPGELASNTGYALWIPLDLVEAAVRSARLSEARSHAAALRQVGVAAISPRLAMLASACAAIAADDDELGDFERALAVAGIDRWPFELARVRLAFGERLRRTRAVSEARVQLAGALETFTRLGAAPWVARAAAELRATGVAGAGGVGPAQPHDRDALSPQEREIAMLAATGLTNKQIGQRLFLSHRTIGAHLYRIYPKLGITSRAALRDALLSLPEDGPGPS